MSELDERAAQHKPPEAKSPKRFYVSITWEDWPNAGSFGDVVFADDAAHAEAVARWKMATARAEEDGCDAYDVIRLHGDDWHVVDCFALDDFIREHAPSMIHLAAYEGDAGPYAAAFSTRALAESFAATVAGTVIETAIDVHRVDA
ncbi:MAG: hypothetical protein EA385_15120 [Salinarimonadaceae bacterium]|nr:MAG: hypothetical protein EA385_15120 [Salinarimonadaceae bacterium]